MATTLDRAARTIRATAIITPSTTPTTIPTADVDVGIIGEGTGVEVVAGVVVRLGVVVRFGVVVGDT